MIIDQHAVSLHDSPLYARSGVVRPAAVRHRRLVPPVEALSVVTHKWSDTSVVTARCGNVIGTCGVPRDLLVRIDEKPR